MTSADQEEIVKDLDLMWELFIKWTPLFSWNSRDKEPLKKDVDNFLDAKIRIRSKVVDNLDIVENVK